MRYRALVLAAFVFFGVSACTRSDDTSLSGQALRVGVSDEPDSLNPLFSHTAIADDIAALTLAPLFRYDDLGAMIPELAVRVPTVSNGDMAANGLRVTFRLRPRLRWSDGKPLTSRDLVFTWHAVMNPANNTKLRAGWENIRSIVTPDDHTAIVILRKPDATILTLFAGGGDAAYPPLPAHLLAHLPSLNQAAFNAAPISSGPWILGAWQHGSSLSFTANKAYWRGAPQIQQIQFLVFPQAGVLMTALQTHEIDYVDNVPEDRLFMLHSMQHELVIRHIVAAYRHLDFNTRDPLLHDARVRLAMIEGIHWDRLLHTVYHDAGLRATSDIFPTSFAAPHIPLYLYDFEDAARLLDSSGWKLNAAGQRVRNGTALNVTIMSANTKETSMQAELQIANDLARLGIRVDPKNVPTSYLFAEHGPLYSGRYQLAWAVDTRGPDPDNADDWMSSAQPPHGGNTVFLSDKLVDQTAAAAKTAIDPAVRRMLYQQEEERLHQLAPSFIFTWQRATVAMTPHLYGVRPVPFYSNFWNSWQWRLK